MGGPSTQLYLHLAWATWDRLPLITEALEARLSAAIAKKCHALHCNPLALGGVPDHIHLLVELHPSVAVAVLAKEVKGGSSHLVTHERAPSEFFKECPAIEMAGYPLPSPPSWAPRPARWPIVIHFSRGREVGLGELA